MPHGRWPSCRNPEVRLATDRLAGGKDRYGLSASRQSARHAKVVDAEIDALLNAGKDVAIFPEGTTNRRHATAGFHGALLQPAVETGRLVPAAGAVLRNAVRRTFAGARLR